jgi:glyoxylase-like metal-dependent hydrolase (beta-lactamase superfamily II)
VPRAILLTHIHFDHAGATGALCRLWPQAEVWVHERGARHMADPSRLVASAKRIYGEQFDRLWGEVVPVPDRNVQDAGDRVLGLDAFPTPGHASHHVSYLDQDGTLYSGDAAGVRIQPHTHVLPPTPPPEFDLETWLQTLDEVERRAPERLALIHFGVAEDVGRHLEELRRRLLEWVGLDGVSEEQFAKIAGRDVDRIYERAMPYDQSYAGLKRYWEKSASG